MPKQGYRDLLVWQQAMQLAADCYRMTRGFPREETYGLTSQIRRDASSVPANIAEGSGRGSPKDFVNFLRISRGSLRELETYLLLAKEIDLLDQPSLQPLLDQADSVSRLLTRLIQSQTPKPP